MTSLGYNEITHKGRQIKTYSYHNAFSGGGGGGGGDTRAISPPEPHRIYLCRILRQKKEIVLR